MPWLLLLVWSAAHVAGIFRTQHTHQYHLLEQPSGVALVRWDSESFAVEGSQMENHFISTGVIPQDAEKRSCA